MLILLPRMLKVLPTSKVRQFSCFSLLCLIFLKLLVAANADARRSKSLASSAKKEFSDALEIAKSASKTAQVAEEEDDEEDDDGEEEEDEDGEVDGEEEGEEGDDDEEDLVEDFAMSDDESQNILKEMF